MRTTQAGKLCHQHPGLGLASAPYIAVCALWAKRYEWCARAATRRYEELLWCKGDVLEATVGTSRRIVGAHRRGAGRDLEKKGEK